MGLEAIRGSKMWKAVGELSVVHWVFTGIAAFGALLVGKAAKVYGRPLYIVLLCGFAAFAFLTVGFYGGSKLIERFLAKRRNKVSSRNSQVSPKLFLEYHPVPAQYILEFSGLTLKNIGAPAFNIEFEPEIRSGHTLLMDNPATSVGSNGSQPIFLHYCTVNDKGVKNPMGGVPASRIEHLFNDLLHEGEDSLAITIKCRDFDGQKFTFKSVLRFDRWKMKSLPKSLRPHLALWP